MSDSKIKRLAAEALELKKAWVLGIGIIGKPAGLPLDHLELPNYLQWGAKPLKRQLADLMEDIDEIGNKCTLDWSPIRRKKAVPWMARKYDEWSAANQRHYVLGSVYEVEQAIGRLRSRKFMECPPYAQMLLQGLWGVVIRHPEYHLARDRSLLNNLFMDAEAIGDDYFRNSRPHSTEVNQSLARSVIITCYNLLESVICGLVTEFIMESPTLDEFMMKKLREPDRKRSSLKARFEDVPAIIAGKENVMDSAKKVLDPLFKECKWRRDAFVHCEPGSERTKWGRVKEHDFHDVDRNAVKETVTLTIKAIQAAWRVVHGYDGPRWLCIPVASGRFPNVEVRLQYSEESHEEISHEGFGARTSPLQ